MASNKLKESLVALVKLQLVIASYHHISVKSYEANIKFQISHIKFLEGAGLRREHAQYEKGRIG